MRVESDGKQIPHAITLLKCSQRLPCPSLCFKSLIIEETLEGESCLIAVAEPHETICLCDPQKCPFQVESPSNATSTCEALWEGRLCCTPVRDRLGTTGQGQPP